jgi:hypothetical protein
LENAERSVVSLPASIVLRQGEATTI